MLGFGVLNCSQDSDAYLCTALGAFKYFLQGVDQLRRAQGAFNAINLLTIRIQDYQSWKSIDSEFACKPLAFSFSVLKDAHENLVVGKLDHLFVGIDLTGHSAAVRSPCSRNIQDYELLLFGRLLQSFAIAFYPSDLGRSNNRRNEANRKNKDWNVPALSA
jgi:hypothetical protein